MQIANVKGRLKTFADGSPVDVGEASGGKFLSDPQAVFDRWDAFLLWGHSIGAQGAGALPAEDLRAPVPSPRLLPGDIIFTGTPAAVGHARKLPRYLLAGETLVSMIGGVGSLKTNFV
jgi:hypothetical protein